MRDYQRREGIMLFRIEGNDDKVRFIPVTTEAQRLIHASVETSKHGEDMEGPLFRPFKNNTTGELRKSLHPKSVYQDIVVTPTLGVHYI
jgi:integrase/recombinase XerD